MIAVNSRIRVPALGKPPLRRSGRRLQRERSSLGAFGFQVKDLRSHAILAGANLGFETARSGTRWGPQARPGGAEVASCRALYGSSPRQVQLSRFPAALEAILPAHFRHF